MEFLKEILGEELFNQFTAKVNEYNGNEANKEKQVKLGNLGSGEYVGKGKHEALQALFDGQKTELQQANDLIAELKKSTKGNEDLQGKIAQYETANQQLKEELAETKLKSAVKVALLSEKAVDVDYLTFKLQEKLKDKGEKLELDDNDNIKGWETQLEGLKTQFPTMFEAGQKKMVDPNKLPDPNNVTTLTKAELLKKPYAERAKLLEENPEAYNAAMGN